MRNKILFLQGKYSAATKASSTEVLAGTDDAKYVTPAASAFARFQYVFNRAAKAILISDGATANRCVPIPNSTRGNLAGAPVASFHGKIPAPSSSSTAGISGRSSTITAAPSATAWAMGIAWSGDDLVIFANGATPATDYRKYTLTGARTAYGSFFDLDVLITAGSATDPVAKINGVTVAGIPSAGGGTNPDWLSSSLVDTWTVHGYVYASGQIPLGTWINAALSDNDRAYIQITGQFPKWIVDGGSRVSLQSHVSGADLAGGTYWNYTNLTSVTSGQSDPDGGTEAVVCVPSADGALFYNSVSYRPSPVVGAKYIAGIWLKAAVGTPTLRIELASASFPTLIKDCILSTAWQFFSFGQSVQATATSSMVMYIGGTGTFTGKWSLAMGSIYIYQPTIWQVGSLGLPIIGPDRTVRDGTRLSPAVDGYMVGMSPLCTEADGWIRGRRTTDGYLQADAQLVGDGRGVVQVLLLSTSGGTVTLGDSAGAPATLVASVSLTAGVVTPCTILKSLTTGGKIYVDLGTATDVTVYVRTGPITAFA